MIEPTLNEWMEGEDFELQDGVEVNNIDGSSTRYKITSEGAASWAMRRLTSAQAKGADVFLRRLKRSYPISEAISGAVTYTIDPLTPDNIQVIEVHR